MGRDDREVGGSESDGSAGASPSRFDAEALGQDPLTTLGMTGWEPVVVGLRESEADELVSDPSLRSG